MCNGVDKTNTENYKECFSNSEKVKDFAKRFPLGHSAQEKKKKWYGTHTCKPQGKWNSAADVMVDNFKDSRHPVCRTTSTLDRCFLEKKSGRCLVQFNAESANVELLFRKINSANQLNIYGAVANWCDELTQLIHGHTHLNMKNPSRW